ncbi:restriction endonuclease subunit S [Ruminococcus sp. AF17-6LB]|uniref:restriction endonuclease subunit S n=1 Tax=unclassified Ruminococcus TaxID=2608920 RepID=UPI000E4E0717|nr:MULTISPECIES: restriction endonuclease subunit S [unclassified Ruminococcus]RGG72092.1 restriction endonuclease subunit S [Ruminococcus sp. AF17-6LB]RGG73832.1 restriction endonuclease subunit S [Ruminococcus sp. AF17-6]
MTAQQLKNSILQMAVQGKLVPQDPSDEPASVLLERIKAEKQELIKAGKIKKDKKSSEIFRGAAHNLPYVFCEQIGKEIRDISDEIPFEIPDSWEWVRLGSIVYNRGQMKPTSDFCYVDIGSIDNKRQRLGDTENIITPDKAPSRAKKIIDVGDIIYSTVRPYLHNMCIIDRQFSLQPIASTGFATMTCYSGLLNKYLFYYLLAPDFDNYANDTENSKGVAYPAINDDRLYKALIPLPPLSEQHRIVAKIEELLPYIERYGKAEEHITALNTTFPEALKKSILQEAVQGKLVPQDPDDEPASVLLERIRVEKQKLIKAGKIKKSKHESVIVTRDKIPYEIPDSWVWCKLSDLAILENGDRSSKYPVEADYVEIGIPFFGAKDIDGDMMSFQNVRFISQQKYDELGNGKLVDGDIICLLRGSVGKTAKFEANEQFDTGFICAQMLIIRLLDKSLFGYISSYFKSPDYTNYVESKVTGTAVRQMPAKEMGNLLIPLPPLAEQHRIVAKIEEIMPMIERLTLR